MRLTEIFGIQPVARGAGVTNTAVRKWVGGTEPRTETTLAIDELAEALPHIAGRGRDARSLDQLDHASSVGST